MEQFEIESEIEKGIDSFKKGQSLIAFRRKLISDGIEVELATTISKLSYNRFLLVSGKTKIIRGLIWSFLSVATGIWLFYYGNKISYLLSITTIWGVFQVLSGYFQRNSAKKLVLR
jgi:hypothetical protein